MREAPRTQNASHCDGCVYAAVQLKTWLAVECRRTHRRGRLLRGAAAGFLAYAYAGMFFSEQV